MARFIGWLTAFKGNNRSDTSRTSASMVQASARGWNVGGTVSVRAGEETKKGPQHDSVRLEVDGGSTGSLAGYTVAWLTGTEGKPALHIHIPTRWTMEHDFSEVVLTDDETDEDKVIYTAPVAEEK